MAERELLVRIVGDDRDLQRALGNTDRRLKQIDDRTATFGRNIGRAFAAAGIAVGTAAAFRFADRAVDAAVAVNEEISKSEQIFGSSAQEIQAWSQTTADAIGISQRAALEASGTFGNLLRVTGILPGEAAAMSQALVELAADLASFNNADPSDVLNAIRSGLIGEAEPLRRYGVLLSEARVQQVAMAATGNDNAKELTNQEKALARYNIILQDTAPAQGDFARTSGGLANQSRILRAQLADLSAELGNELLPGLVASAKAANAVFDAFDALGTGLSLDIDIETTDLATIDAMRQKVAALKGESDLLVRALDQVIDRIRATEPARPDNQAGLRGPGSVAITNAQVDARNAEKAAKEAKRAAARRQKTFDEFVKGQGLKLDQAALTRSLQDDLAVLRAIEQAVQRRIAQEGRTFKLVEQLASVRLEIQRTTEQAAAEAQQAGEDAFHATIDALDLNLEMARATRSMEDDQAALRALEQAILRRISTEGQTTDLMRQLFNVREEQRRVAEQLAEQARERRQGRQFEALGLTDEGERRTPGVGALSRRLQNLRDQIKGTVLDTEKTRRELDRIAEVLSGKFGAVGKEVREAILQMFNDIAGALDQGSGKKGPLTKFVKRGAEDLLAGLGLSEEEVKALRQRLAQLGPGGTAPGKGIGAFGFAIPAPVAATPSGPIVIENRIYIDGEEVESRVTRRQQRKDGRTAKQRRGTRAGR